MDGATLPPFPHYTWFALALAVHAPKVLETYEHRHVTARLLLTVAGDADITWTTDGRGPTVHVTPGDIGFYPCDRAVHGLAITAAGGYEGYMLLLPAEHVGGRHGPDESPAPVVPAMPVFRDALMHASLLRLAGGGTRRDIAEAIGDEVAARQIVNRLCAVAGVAMPTWRQQSSCFAPAVMREIVVRVDEQLAANPSLESVSRGFGLSTGHFAKKFRQSTGLSLHRFMNMRRVGVALALLSERDVSLAQLSLDLGFCSQSHFTRLFRGLTGITPHKFIRFRRGMGR